MICQNCKKEIPDDVSFCPHCGQKVLSDENHVESSAFAAGQTDQLHDLNDSKGNTEEPEEPGRGKAIASMVLGIVSVVFFFTGIGAIVSIICGIVGLVIANQSKKEGNNSGIRTAGFVLSLIGLIIGAIVTIASIILISVAGTALSILGS